MLPEFGLFSLILAFCFSVLLTFLPLMGILKNKSHWVRLSPKFAFAQWVFVAIAYGILTYCFISDDFSILYVASNSSRELPIWYKICAVWGAHEGSMLLWVSILSTWMLAVTLFRTPLDDNMLARTLSVLGFISSGFFLFLLTVSNPFTRLLTTQVINGRDLNPLLQDPGFLFHPPTLYTGYVGFSIAFAMAIASLMAGKLDNQWAKWSRPWTLAAWCALTMGITLGSWWAYRELGWGGWWFWDPVENASFMPWLVGTALIHSLAVTEKRQAFKIWTVLLAITTFSLSLLGTFLVRSGILTSVHAFAVSPGRGLFMLIFLLTVIGLSLIIYAFRAPVVAKGHSFSLLSRETLLMLNNVFLFVMMITVLLGTLYPLFIDALGLGKLSVGAPYFNSVFVPLILPLLFLMGIGPHCQWQQMPADLLVIRLRGVFLLSLLLGFFVPWSMTNNLSFKTALAVSLALWLILATLYDAYLKIKTRQKLLSQAQWGMVFAHLGMAFAVLGITLSSGYSVEKFVQIEAGDDVTIAHYRLHFDKTQNLLGPNYSGTEGVFSLYKGNVYIATLYPQKRIYTVQNMAMTDSAIHAGFFRDIYLALGEPIGKKAWTLRVYYKPFIRFIWGGGFFIFIGGLLAMSDKRYYQRKKEKNQSCEVVHE